MKCSLCGQEMVLIRDLHAPLAHMLCKQCGRTEVLPKDVLDDSGRLDERRVTQKKIKQQLED